VAGARSHYGRVRNRKTAFVGVAVLRFASGPALNVPSAIGATIADLLITAGDVEARMHGD
jgi:hypothetical protein